MSITWFHCRAALIAVACCFFSMGEVPAGEKGGISSFITDADEGCGCNSCETCLDGPRFSARVGFALMDRSTPDDAVLFFNPGNAAQSINASDFNFALEGGIDAALTADSLLGTIGGEVRYLSIDGWNAAANTSTAGAVTTLINNDPVTTLVGGYNISSNYGSKLDSLEVNFRLPANDWLIVMAGYRQFELEERLTTNFTGGTADALYDVHTNNQLYGAQLGADARLLCRGCYTIDAIGKVGIFGNNSRHSSRLAQGMLDVTAAESTDETSFIGELGVFGTFELTRRLAFRVGYQMMWVEQVALASDQLAATSFVFFDGIDTSGGVFYHGGFVGLEGTW